MKSRVVVSLLNEEREALIKLALRQLRTPAEQAHYLLRGTLVRMGLLSPAVFFVQLRLFEFKDEKEDGQ